MKDAVPTFLAVLLVCALPATVAVADSGSAVEPPTGDHESVDGTAPLLQEGNSSGRLVNVDGRPNQLVLNDAEPASYTGTGPDLGTALAVGDDDLRDSVGTYHFEERYPDWTNADRQLAIDAEIEQIDERIDELAARERRTVQAHADGNITDRQLLQTLVRIAEQASAMHDRLTEFQNRGDELLGYNADVRSLQAQLDTHRSQLRTQIRADALASSRNEHTVAVRTTDAGLSVALANDAEYVRETIRYDNRDTSREDQLAASGPSERFRQLYPWVDQNTNSRAFDEFLDAQLYVIDIPHPQGELHAFLDGGTGSVFHEVQSLHLSELPKTPLEETWTNGSVEVAINETPANGPIEVAVRERSSGDPIDATISLDGTAVTRTGEDGIAWVIPPAEEYVVTATTDEAAVNATVSNRS